MTDDAVSPSEPTPESSAPTPESVAEPVLTPEVIASEPDPGAVLVPPSQETTIEPASAPETVPEAAIPEESRSQPQPTTTSSSNWSKIDPARARARRTKRVDEALEKILVFAREEKFITNDMVEELLHVSGATATRYLNMLVVRGKLRREGKGRGAKYRVV